MSESTNGSRGLLSGIGETLKNSAATQRLADEAKQYARARAGRVVDNLGSRLTSVTDRLDGIADPAAVKGALAGGKKLIDGKSTTNAGVTSVLVKAREKLTEKVKSVFGKGKGGGGSPKMTSIVENVDVGLPVDQVYDQWTQYGEFSKFMKGVEGVEQTSEVESNWRVKVFKSRRTWKATTTEQIPERRIAWTSEGAKGSTKGVVTFHPLADDLTRILLVMEYYPSGFFEKIGNIWRSGGRRARLDLKHFRRFVMMNGEATGPGWRGEIQDSEVVRQPDEPGGEEETREVDQERGAAEERTGEGRRSRRRPAEPGKRRRSRRRAAEPEEELEEPEALEEPEEQPEEPEEPEEPEALDEEEEYEEEEPEPVAATPRPRRAREGTRARSRR